MTRRARIALLLMTLSTGAAAAPKPVVLDTDMTFDVDDVGALAVLHALADLGEVELLAVNYNEVHASGVAAIRAINAWYGRPDTPVGAYRGTLEAPDASRYLDRLAEAAQSTPSGEAPSALDVYRRALRQRTAVTIVSVGFLNNLHDLMRAEPELVAARVAELVVMGGRHDDRFNFVRHGLVATTGEVLAHWPTPLVISDFGGSVLTGSALAETPPENPVREAYLRWFDGTFRGRSSWDQVAVLYGVRGTGGLFERETSGTARLPNGFELALSPGWRSYLRATCPPEQCARLIEELMVASPRR